MAETILICGSTVRTRTKCPNQIRPGQTICATCEGAVRHRDAAKEVARWRDQVRSDGIEVTEAHIALIRELTWEEFGSGDTSAPKAHWEFPWGDEYDIWGAAQTLGWYKKDDWWSETDEAQFVYECARWVVFETVEYVLPILTRNPTAGLQPGVYRQSRSSRLWEKVS